MTLYILKVVMKKCTVYYDGLTEKTYWFVVINFFLVTASLNFFPTYLSLLAEDSLTENLGALFLFLTSIALVMCAFLAFKERKLEGQEKFDIRWLLFGLAAIAFFWASGEEISWGQRIFGLVTPESLSAVNQQNETNLHNLNTRFFNNALETIILLLILVPTVLYHFNIQRVLKIKVPSFYMILAFQLIACFKTYNYVKDQDYIAYLILLYWLWIMVRKGDKKGISMVILNTVIIVIVGFSNFHLQDLLPTNGSREFREYLFSFLCLSYSLYLYLDIKRSIQKNTN